MNERIYIKNMVCNRCKMAVSHVLNDMGIEPLQVELGEVTLPRALSVQETNHLKQQLEQLGFEYLDDKRQKLVSSIKTLIIEMLYSDGPGSNLNLSTYLSDKLHQDYSALSKLFSDVEGITIERYFILQRIERVKELIQYQELSLKQIAVKLDYSSVAYLSSQFKNVTGMTPSEFKKSRKTTRKEIDQL